MVIRSPRTSMRRACVLWILLVTCLFQTPRVRFILGTCRVDNTHCDEHTPRCRALSPHRIDALAGISKDVIMRNIVTGRLKGSSGRTPRGVPLESSHFYCPSKYTVYDGAYQGGAGGFELGRGDGGEGGAEQGRCQGRGGLSTGVPEYDGWVYLWHCWMWPLSSAGEIRSGTWRATVGCWKLGWGWGAVYYKRSLALATHILHCEPFIKQLVGHLSTGMGFSICVQHVIKNYVGKILLEDNILFGKRDVSLH